MPPNMLERARVTLCLGASALCMLALALILAPGAIAQGCAMCYQNAASADVRGQAALRQGILILLVPALSVFLGLLALIYRRDSPRRN